MKIQYCSDLHLEFLDNRIFLSHHPLTVVGDVLILAGDIAPMHKKYSKYAFFDFVSDHYQQVYWLAGNHEYYNRDFADFHDSFDIPIRKNVHLVNNYTCILNHVKLVFTTLWSQIRPENARLIERSVSDFSCILNEGNKIDAGFINNLHRRCYNFLEETLDPAVSDTVVITHHLPAKACNSDEYMHSKINDAFCVDLTTLIEKCNARYWIYGHSHYNQHSLKIGNTTLLTNQLGYVQAGEHHSFRGNACIEL